MGYDIQQSTADSKSDLYFLMVDSTDHVTGKTGLSPTVRIKKNGVASAVPTGVVSEVDATNHPGLYKVAANATDNATLGPLELRATGTAADPTDDMYRVVPFNPYDVVRLGLTSLPNAAAEAAGGLYTRGTGAGQINQSANGQIDVNVPAGVTVSTNNDKTGYALSTAGVLAIWHQLTAAIVTASTIGKKLVDLAVGTDNRVLVSADTHTAGVTVAAVTAGITLPASESQVVTSGTATNGGASTITLAAGETATAAIHGNLVHITSGLGIGQTRTVIGYVVATKVLTVDRAWTVIPDATSVYAVLKDNTAALTSTLQVTTTASDPLLNAVPGAYSVGTAGHAIGTFLDAAVSDVPGLTWDELRASHVISGSMGQGVASVQGNLTGSAGSVIAPVTVGGYSAGQDPATLVLTTPAQKLNTDSAGSVKLQTGTHTGAVIPTVSTLTNDAGITQAGADKVWGTATRTLSAFAFAVTISAGSVQAIWDALTSALTTTGSIGKRLVEFLAALGSDDRPKMSADGHTGGATIPAVSGAVGSVTAPVTAGTVSDKAGYALTAGEHTNIVTDVGSGLTAQGYTAPRAVLLSNLDAAISTLLTSAGYTVPPTAAANATALLTDLLSSSDFNTVGSFGKMLKDRIDVVMSTLLDSASYVAPDNASITTILADTANLKTRVPAALQSGRMDVYLGATATSVITADSLAPDAGVEIRTGLATASALATMQLDVTAIAEDANRIPASPSTAAQVALCLQTSGYTAPDNAGISTAAAQSTAGAASAASAASTATTINGKVGTPVVTLASDIAAVLADTANLKARTPAALVNGHMSSHVAQILADAISDDSISDDAVTKMQTGAASAANLATLTSNLALVKTNTDKIGLTVATSAQVAACLQAGDYVLPNNAGIATAATQATAAASSAAAAAASGGSLVTSVATFGGIRARIPYGMVDSNKLVAYQHSAFVFPFEITNDAGVAVSQAGDTIKFVAYALTPAQTVDFQITGVVSGASNSIVTVTGTGALHTLTPRVLKYVLRNLTDDIVLADGTLEIRPQADSTP